VAALFAPSKLWGDNYHEVDLDGVLGRQGSEEDIQDAFAIRDQRSPAGAHAGYQSDKDRCEQDVKK
jgi:hypothetical protein